jgi:hypothetical protein
MCRDISLRRNDIRSFGRVIPGATSANLGWVELQEVRYQGLDRWNIAAPSNTEANFGLHHPCRAKYCAGVSCSGSSASGYSGCTLRRESETI